MGVVWFLRVAGQKEEEEGREKYGAAWLGPQPEFQTRQRNQGAPAVHFKLSVWLSAKPLLKSSNTHQRFTWSDLSSGCGGGQGDVCVCIYLTVCVCTRTYALTKEKNRVPSDNEGNAQQGQQMIPKQ